MRLLTIPISHYCERARWALNYAGVEFREEQHLQMFHAKPVKRAGGRHRVPLLVTPDGPLTDSADIVAFADAQAPEDRRLYSDSAETREQILAVEAPLAGDFGVETRRWAYGVLLPQRKMIYRYNGARAPLRERLALRLGFRFAAKKISSYLDVTPETVVHARDFIMTTFDQVGERLADGRPYLMGERFTAADLTFASLAAPAVYPVNYGVPLPGLHEFAEQTAAQIRRFRDHPAGAHALKMYSQKR